MTNLFTYILMVFGTCGLTFFVWEKLGQKCYKQLTGHAIFCSGWWSKFDCLEQIAVDWAVIMPSVLVNIVQQSTTQNCSASAMYNLLMENRRSKEDMIRLELAAVIDGGSVFRNRTYFFEVDGPLIFVAYDKVMSMFVLKTLSGRMLM